MKIIWNGHSCFTIKCKEGTVVLDPFADGYVPGYPAMDLSADLVLCSHEHSDHNAKQVVSVSGKPCEIGVECIASWHDEVQGAKRGSNTIHVLSAEGMRVAHLGDLGCALTEEQAAALQNLDALMIPIGGFYTIDAQQAAEIVRQLKPRVVIPMHYRFEGHGYDVLSTLDAFLALCENPVDYPGNTFDLDGETEAQTAILHL